MFKQLAQFLGITLSTGGLFTSVPATVMAGHSNPMMHLPAGSRIESNNLPNVSTQTTVEINAGPDSDDQYTLDLDLPPNQTSTVVTTTTTTNTFSSENGVETVTSGPVDVNVKITSGPTIPIPIIPAATPVIAAETIAASKVDKVDVVKLAVNADNDRMRLAFVQMQQSKAFLNEQISNLGNILSVLSDTLVKK